MKETVKSLSDKLEKALTRIDWLELNSTDKKIEPDNGIFKPKAEEEYYYLDGGDIESFLWTNAAFDKDAFSIGGCYETKEQAQAVIDLRKHIYKFPMPEKSDGFYLLSDKPDGKGFVEFWGSNNPMLVKIDYHSGIEMHKNTLKKDREERVRLLGLAYKVS